MTINELIDTRKDLLAEMNDLYLQIDTVRDQILELEYEYRTQNPSHDN